MLWKGAVLKAVYGTFHQFRDSVDMTSALGVWLLFEQRKPLHISGASDGETILTDSDDPQAFDMGESGRVVIVDISKRCCFDAAVGRELRRIDAIRDRRARLLGLRFDFGLDIRPIVINWGDELWVRSAYPLDNDALIETLFE